MDFFWEGGGEMDALTGHSCLGQLGSGTCDPTVLSDANVTVATTSVGRCKVGLPWYLTRAQGFPPMVRPPAVRRCQGKVVERIPFSGQP